MADTTFTVRARDRTAGAARSASRNLGGITGALNGMRGSLAGLAGPFGAFVGPGGLAGIGVAAVAAVAGLAKLGAQIEGVEQRLQRTTGLTGDALDEAAANVIAIARTVPNALNEVGLAYGTAVAKFGPADSGLEAVTRASLATVRLWGGDLKRVFDDVAAAAGIFGLTTSQGVTRAFDVLDFIARRLNINFNELSSTLRVYGPVLDNLGFGFDTAAGFLGILNSRGIDASRIMPGLNAFMRTLASEGVQDLEGAFLRTANEIFNARTEASALNLAAQAFGAEGAQRMVEVIRGGGGIIPALEELRFALLLSDHSVAEFERGNRTSTDRLRTAWNDFRLAFAGVGSFVVDTIAVLLDVMSSLANAAASNFRRLSSLEIAFSVPNIGFGSTSFDLGPAGSISIPTFDVSFSNVSWRPFGTVSGLAQSAVRSSVLPFGEQLRARRAAQGGGGLSAGGFDDLLTRTLEAYDASRLTAPPRRRFDANTTRLQRPVEGGLAPIYDLDPSAGTFGSGRYAPPVTQVTNNVNVEILGDNYGIDDLEDIVTRAFLAAQRAGESSLSID